MLLHGRVLEIATLLHDGGDLPSDFDEGDAQDRECGLEGFVLLELAENDIGQFLHLLQECHRKFLIIVYQVLVAFLHSFHDLLLAHDSLYVVLDHDRDV